MAQIIETEGIILKVIKYSETSLIMDIFTFQDGLKSCIVSGVRSTKSKTSSSLYQVMNVIQFSYYHKESEQLYRIKECHYAHHYQHLQVEVIKSAVATFMIEVTRNAIREKESNETLYQFIKSQFIALDTLEKIGLAMYPIQYMVRLTVHLGFFPMDNWHESRPYFDLLNGSYTDNALQSKYMMDSLSSALFARWLKNDYTIIGKSDRDKLIDYLVLYYNLHIDTYKPLKSLEILREILS